MYIENWKKNTPFGRPESSIKISLHAVKDLFRWVETFICNPNVYLYYLILLYYSNGWWSGVVIQGARLFTNPNTYHMHCCLTVHFICMMSDFFHLRLIRVEWQKKNITFNHLACILLYAVRRCRHKSSIWFQPSRLCVIFCSPASLTSRPSSYVRLLFFFFSSYLLPFFSFFA